MVLSSYEDGDRERKELFYLGFQVQQCLQASTHPALTPRMGAGLGHVEFGEKGHCTLGKDTAVTPFILQHWKTIPDRDTMCSQSFHHSSVAQQLTQYKLQLKTHILAFNLEVWPAETQVPASSVPSLHVNSPQ